ncbi:ATP-binding cassette domain-containing protein [Propionivibrio limicola]|uniref:ATP-binding cassette domain-containing protein n=1 Tax=Propionivibrio limicola TaxID=167645 RepID=UPI001FE735D2|nr:ATP-binding cassette domain-containing protein [Propionivibrio limicola]
MAMKEAPILVADHLSKSFTPGRQRIQALDAVSFAIRPGVITGLIGPDAAGKTTLMRLAAGLLVPDSGSIHALGLDATHDSLTVQASLGYMPQRFGLYEDLTVQENLDLYADLQGVAKDVRGERYGELMHMTGLQPFVGRLAGKLSGGMKQKLGLACTLVRPPRLLLLDEPTVGVDPVSRRELWSIIDRLVASEGMSVLLSTAYLDEAERCDEVILLHEGKVMAQGIPAEMSATLRGRTWTVSLPGRQHRALQMRLAQTAGVVDALVQGERIRLVTEQAQLPDAIDSHPDMHEATVDPVAPRFEDLFVDMLRGRPNSTPHATHLDFAPISPHADGDATAPVIKVDRLIRCFGDFRAVDGISFDVRRGEIFGLLGANGAGKSTTFRMLCGLLPPSSGHLEVAGLDLRHAASAARARIGYMSQKFSQYGNLSVGQNLAFFASAYGLANKARAERLAWAEDEFDLVRYRNQLAGDLPLGYKQRLAMACALMHRPEILFLDEPTSGVDPLARREFWQRINALALSGVTVLVTTHFMEEAEYCDRLVIMAAGRILTVGEPAAIKAAVRSPELPEPSMEDAFIKHVEET